MNLGFDAKRYFFNQTGLGNYSRQFIDALAKNQIGQFLFLFSPKKPRNEFFIRGKIKLITPSGFWKIFNGTLWRSFGIYFSLKKENIHTFIGLSNELPVFIPKKVRKIVVIHDLIFIRFPELYPPLDRFIYQIKTKIACRRAHQIIAVSAQTKQDLIAFYKIPASKICVIPPITDSIYYPENSNSEKRLIQENYILSVGSITKRKNLWKTVVAFQKIHHKTAANLVVVGSILKANKIYLAEINNFISTYKMTSRVKFLGDVSDETLRNLYKNAEYLVYPSQFEGFGMPITESLFSKTPVITSKGGCFEEAGGGGALYIDPENADELAETMEKLLKNEELRNDLAEKGFAHVQKFSRENVKKLIVSVLEDGFAPQD